MGTDGATSRAVQTRPTELMHAFEKPVWGRKRMEESEMARQNKMEKSAK